MRSLFGLGLLVVLFSSCEKDDSNPIIEEEVSSTYFPFEIGNYWIYKHYDIDSNGIENELDIIDSITISRDTLINNKKYFILSGRSFPSNTNYQSIINILRDSSGCIVSHTGKVIFSPNNFSDTLYKSRNSLGEDNEYIISYKMEKTPSRITVPAGEYDVLNYKGTFKTVKPNEYYKSPRYTNQLYAKNVGMVFQSYFYLSSDDYSEKRLVRYYIKNAI